MPRATSSAIHSRCRSSNCTLALYWHQPLNTRLTCLHNSRLRYELDMAELQRRLPYLCSRLYNEPLGMKLVTMLRFGYSLTAPRNCTICANARDIQFTTHAWCCKRQTR